LWVLGTCPALMWLFTFINLSSLEKFYI